MRMRSGTTFSISKTSRSIKRILAVLQYVFDTVETEPVDESDPESKVPHCSICGKPMILIEIVAPGEFDVRKEMPESAAKPP